MKKLHIIRIAVLITLLTAGIMGIFAMPADDSQRWLSDLLLSKISGLSCLWIFARLYAKWRKSDRWIKAYDEWAKAGC